MAKVLLIVGGGIAAYKALELVRLLKKAGHEVTPVLTKSGEHFVTAMSVTRAPASAAAAAIAKPWRPDERLAITRTGSIGSHVGPAVTRTCLPLKSSLAAELRGRGTAEGGGGGELSCIDCRRDGLEHTVEVLQHVDSRDAHDLNALRA